MIGADDLRIWVDAYIEAQQDADLLKEGNPHWWAVNRFMDDDTDPEDCWLAILAILSKGPPANVLGVLAAGPLEDLVEYHGPQFIDRIEVEARRSSAFRDLLSGVWKSSTPEIWSRIETASAK
jgi:hypothetical protein